jgi:hypothetical protein
MTNPNDIDRADAAHEDDVDGVPCPGALLAGTLALMTAWADPCDNAHCTAARQRHLMARKIVSNLFFLKEHPQVAPMLRNVMANAHRRWLLVAASVEDVRAEPVPTGATLH